MNDSPFKEYFKFYFVRYEQYAIYLIPLLLTKYYLLCGSKLDMAIFYAALQYCKAAVENLHFEYLKISHFIASLIKIWILYTDEEP